MRAANGCGSGGFWISGGVSSSIIFGNGVFGDVGVEEVDGDGWCDCEEIDDWVDGSLSLGTRVAGAMHSITWGSFLLIVALGVSHACGLDVLRLGSVHVCVIVLL